MKKFIFVFLLMDFVCLLSANAQWGNGDHIDKVLERKRKEAEARSSRTSNNTSTNRSIITSSKTSSVKSDAFNESTKNKVLRDRDAKTIANRIDNFKNKSIKEKPSNLDYSENNMYKQRIAGGLLKGQASENLKTVYARSINARELAKKGNKDIAADVYHRTFIDLEKVDNFKSKVDNTSRNSNKGNVKNGVSSYNSRKNNKVKNYLASHNTPKPNKMNASSSPVNKKNIQAGIGEKRNGQDKKRIQTGIQNSKKPLRSGAELWKARKKKESLSPEEDAKLDKWLEKQKEKTYN